VIEDYLIESASAKELSTMVLKTGKEYIESLRKRGPLKIYMLGEKVEDPLEHPIIRASINSVALTYDLAHDSEVSDLMTAKSVITGKTINRFCHLHNSTEDLQDKVKMQRLLGQVSGTCFQRCVGMDALNAVYLTTVESDKKFGTDYHKRFIDYVKIAEDEDWVIDGCMTDPKGDRSKRPSEQKDPDVYVHVAERTDEGVVIRGAKAHQTGAVNSHEHLIMPTLAMRNEDKDYAICCAKASPTTMDDNHATFVDLMKLKLGTWTVAIQFMGGRNVSLCLMMFLSRMSVSS
jgi:4-hydroxybutyryl-CoA dehydratase/vinylacetyl-CoA-Delta-isomerase